MSLPDFLIIGAQKAATTWLRRLLRDHSGVFMPEEEVRFFNRTDTWSCGIDWYAEHFQEASAHQLVGEKTPNYLWTNPPDVERYISDPHRRIVETISDVKLIVILRDPVDRVVSAYNHHLRQGRIAPHLPMEQVLFGDHQSLAREFGILSMSMYDRHLDDYLSVFDRDQLLVLFFEEDIVAKPERGLQRTCNFLGVDRADISGDPDHHLSPPRPSKARLYLDYWLPIPSLMTRPVDFVAPSWKCKPSPRLRSRLQEYFRPHVESLFHQIERSVEAWET
ncbi:sulfotransferase domain-containing protein [Salinibacter sp.]|uniref:sulfotransferase domain-containing protein n=1 Tax=Salinibacter sp. TaxID=2065818 RepID=UPI0021E8FBB7|nr:sulfotransferase domain-containing protein [Salinibacter sp.]